MADGPQITRFRFWLWLLRYCWRSSRCWRAGFRRGGQSENNRRARLYKLTPAGRKQLKQEVADFERVLEAILRVMQPT